MIIMIRGTSGSGKSTIVRKLMDLYPTWLPEQREGRKRPIGYKCEADGHRPLWVAGHYETPCGGCDTLPTIDNVYYLVNKAAEAEYDVVYEGLLIQSDIVRCVELGKRFPLIVIGLNTPLNECLAAIQSRRDARGDTRPLNPANTAGKLNSLPGQQRRLTEGNVDFRLLNRDEAYELCLKAFGWN